MRRRINPPRLAVWLACSLMACLIYAGCPSPIPTPNEGNKSEQQGGGEQITADNSSVAEPTREPDVGKDAAEPTPEPMPEPTPEPTPEPDQGTPEGGCRAGESKACYSGPDGTAGTGICKRGLQTCQADGTWSSCEGEVTPNPKEICGNKQDDNCDGSTDAEDTATCKCNPDDKRSCYNGPKDTAGKGICKAGTQTCGQDSTWGPCEGEVTPNPKEICGNKQDDNCDGKTDTEDAAVCECDPQNTRPCYTGPKDTENKGACKAGTQTCKPDATWDVCTGDVVPQNEVCDGVDNDCNGKTDDEPSGQTSCAAGQRCLGGKCECDATSCPNGCCDANGQCIGLLNDQNCGTGGVACSTCGQGQRCDAAKGTCVCDATSCPNGCCDSNGQCQTGKSNTACGTGGIACTQCPSGQGCDPGSQVCGCGPSTCTTGCCNAQGQCTTSTTQNCGVSGKACVACDANKADSCANGGCRCGNNPACGAGQRCQGGQCVCDATSCANGCCDGNTCITSRTISKCGNNGAACSSCNADIADNCSNGGCRCGTSASCTGKAKCNNGRCRCDGPSFNNVKINGTAYSNTPIKVAPGSQVKLDASFRLSQPCSSNCITQLVVGNATPGYGNEVIDCAYNGIPRRCPSETTGSKSMNFTAPRSPGTYDIRWTTELQFNCTNARNRFSGLNNSSRPIIARIEVTQPTCGSLSNSVYAISINGGGKEATVAPGATVTVKASYNVAQLNGCPGCIVQLVAGIVGGATPVGVGCFYNGGARACPNPTSGTRTLTFKAPTVAGTYQLRWRTNLQFNCTNAVNRFANSPPGRSNTFGVLIVK